MTTATDFQGRLRKVLLHTVTLRMKTPQQAEDAVRNRILAYGLPLVAVHVDFLPGRRRLIEAAALVDGRPFCVELLTNV